MTFLGSPSDDVSVSRNLMYSEPVPASCLTTLPLISNPSLMLGTNATLPLTSMNSKASGVIGCGRSEFSRTAQMSSLISSSVASRDMSLLVSMALIQLSHSSFWLTGSHGWYSKHLFFTRLDIIVLLMLQHIMSLTQ